MSAVKTSLRKSILSLRTPSAGSQDKHFIPRSQYAKILTRSAVEAEVGRYPAIKSKRTTVDIVCKGAQRIFGILVLCSHIESIVAFVENDHMQDRSLDSCLPIVDEELLRVRFNDDSIAQAFYKWQWEFCCPDFSMPIYPRLFANQIVLPYLTDRPVNAGIHGTIHKIKIHEDYKPAGYRDSPYVRHSTSARPRC